MTDQMPRSAPSSGGEIAPDYETPRLTPVGNLRDLLAGSTGTGCDIHQEPNGSDTHANC
jgi:hypothetical protein